MINKLVITEVTPFQLVITEVNAWNFVVNCVGAWNFVVTEVESDTSVPLCLSAEIGLIDANTLHLVFDRPLNESKIPAASDLILTMSGDLDGIGKMVIGSTFIIA